MSDEDNGPDVNEQVKLEWIADTTPFERVWEVIKHKSEPQTVEQVAEDAYCTTDEARVALGQLITVGVVESSSGDEDGRVRYRWPPELRIVEQARRVLAEADEDTLQDRIEKMATDLENEPDETTRRNLEAVCVALILDGATTTWLETATADPDDWSGSTPTDAGEALFGDGPDGPGNDEPTYDIEPYVKSNRPPESNLPSVSRKIIRWWQNRRRSE